MLITLDGPEGAGKTTLCKHLKSKLSMLGYKNVVLSREPGGTKLGEDVREILINKEMHPKTELLLFMASRMEHIDKVIRPSLKRGDIVILDRFVNSSIAMQGHARGIGIDKTAKLHDFILKEEDIKVDLAFYLDIDPLTGLSRKREEDINKFEKEDILFHNNVREGYMQIDYPNKLIHLDGSIQTSEIADTIINVMRIKNMIGGKK